MTDHARGIIEDCIAIGLHMEVSYDHAPDGSLLLTGRGDPIAVGVVQAHYDAVLALLKADPILARRAAVGPRSLGEANALEALREAIRAMAAPPGALRGEAATPKHPETPPLTQDQRRRVYQAFAQPLPEDLR